MSTTCRTLSTGCATILRATCTQTGTATAPATSTTAGIVKVDCNSADPVAVTGIFRANTLAALKAIPSNTCNKVAYLAAREVFGDITFKHYLWFDGIVQAEELVFLSVITADDGLGQWLQV